jgi:hypothetical protein
VTGLVQRETSALQLAAQAAQLLDFGAMLVKSRMLPQSVSTPEAAVTIMVKGMELGLPPMAALNGITVIQGKPTVSPQLMLSLINRSGQLEDLQIVTSKDGATVTMKRKGRSPFSVTFGPNEALAMGLNTKDNYKKQAPVMYQWRAVAACARVVFPDVIDGMYTPEEMGAEVQVDEDGAMTVTVQQEEKKEAAPVEDTQAEILDRKRRQIRQVWKECKDKGLENDLTPLGSRYPNWRTDADQTDSLRFDLIHLVNDGKLDATWYGEELSETDTAPAETMITPTQIKQLQTIANGAGAMTSADRAALWGYMQNGAIQTTKTLTEVQADNLLEAFRPLTPAERIACVEESRKYARGQLVATK